MKLSYLPKTVCKLIEPAMRSVADRLFILTGGRKGSEKYKPTIKSFYETGLVVSLYEFLLMSPTLAHLEIRHEKPYDAKTRPEQADLWIRPPNGGREHLIECGDFSPSKLKNDADKMRRLNKKGTNWFLAFFRELPDSEEPWNKLQQCRKRKGSLKGLRIHLDERLTKSFTIELPNESVRFGYSLIKIKRRSS